MGGGCVKTASSFVTSRPGTSQHARLESSALHTLMAGKHVRFASLMRQNHEFPGFSCGLNLCFEQEKFGDLKWTRRCVVKCEYPTELYGVKNIQI